MLANCGERPRDGLAAIGPVWHGDFAAGQIAGGELPIYGSRASLRHRGPGAGRGEGDIGARGGVGWAGILRRRLGSDGATGVDMHHPATGAGHAVGERRGGVREDLQPRRARRVQDHPFVRHRRVAHAKAVAVGGTRSGAEPRLIRVVHLLLDNRPGRQTRERGLDGSQAAVLMRGSRGRDGDSRGVEVDEATAIAEHARANHRLTLAPGLPRDRQRLPFLGPVGAGDGEDAVIRQLHGIVLDDAKADLIEQHHHAAAAGLGGCGSRRAQGRRVGTEGWQVGQRLAPRPRRSVRGHQRHHQHRERRRPLVPQTAHRHRLRERFRRAMRPPSTLLSERGEDRLPVARYGRGGSTPHPMRRTPHSPYWAVMMISSLRSATPP